MLNGNSNDKSIRHPALVHYQHFKVTANQVKINERHLYSFDERALLNYYKHPKQAILDGVILLQPEYYAEWFAENFIIKNYLSNSERIQYSVMNADGIFYSKDMKPLEGEYLYCLLPDGNLFCAKSKEVVNHSHLVAGLPVIAAGHAFFKAGNLIILSNNSGHYKPTSMQMLNGILCMGMKSLAEFLFEDHSDCSPCKMYGGIQYFTASHFVSSNGLNAPLAEESVINFVQNKLESIAINNITNQDLSSKDSYDDEIISLSDHQESDGELSSPPDCEAFDKEILPIVSNSVNDTEILPIEDNMAYEPLSLPAEGYDALTSSGEDDYIKLYHYGASRFNKHKRQFRS